MSRKFVRNVTGAKLKGKKIEPYDTNVQNDLLSDETDVYVRQERSRAIKDKYHCLTDDVKEVISNSDLISTENFEHGESEQEDKNKSYINVSKSNKSESEKMESNSHVMTPLQTGYAIEKNNRDVIPNLVKRHETPTEIVSKSDDLKVKKISKNNFELNLNIDNDNVDDLNILMFNSSFSILYTIFNPIDNILDISIEYNEDFFKKVKHLLELDVNDGVEYYSPEFVLQRFTGGRKYEKDFVSTHYLSSRKRRRVIFRQAITSDSEIDNIMNNKTFMYVNILVNENLYSKEKSNIIIDDRKI